MRTQTTIFGDPIPKSHHADDLTDGAVVCRRVLFAVTQCGLRGATVAELAATLGMREAQVGPALGELRMWGRVQKTEARRSNKAVYIAIEKGRP